MRVSIQTFQQAGVSLDALVAVAVAVVVALVVHPFANFSSEMERGISPRALCPTLEISQDFYNSWMKDVPYRL